MRHLFLIWFDIVLIMYIILYCCSKLHLLAIILMFERYAFAYIMFGYEFYGMRPCHVHLHNPPNNICNTFSRNCSSSPANINIFLPKNEIDFLRLVLFALCSRNTWANSSTDWIYFCVFIECGVAWQRYCVKKHTKKTLARHCR